MINSKFNILNKDRLTRRAFSRAALKYDSLTDLHRQIAGKLIEQINRERTFGFILDIGMGTGWLTQQIKNIYPQAQVIGLDFAAGMINHVRKKGNGIDLVLADARQLPFKESMMDLIVSNLAYQWVFDLLPAFELCHRVLRDKGFFSFSVFGDDTFCELYDVLSEMAIFPEGTRQKLTNLETLKNALIAARFRKIELQREVVEMSFKDLMGLLQWTKHIGANRLHSPVSLGKDSLRKASDIYKDRFANNEGITVTFEILRGKCEK